MRARPVRALAVLALFLVVWGCGVDGERASLYRAEKLLYEARKAEAQVRLSRTPPDSTTLRRLRGEYLRVKAAVPGPYKLRGTPEERARALDILKAVGTAEAQGVRLALEARRADLALEQARALQKLSAGDPAMDRQASFMAVAALQGLRRYDDAVAEMKMILRRFPVAPPPPDGEDPVLAIPEAIVNLRRNLGDEETATKELRNALVFYQTLLQRPLAPSLEAQVRARIVRTQLELDQPGAALAQCDALEKLVIAKPQLRGMLAEIAFSKGKIRATIEKDPSEGISILDRIATDFPDSPFAPRALFEAATQLESKGRYAEAKSRYESLLQRFPNAPEAAPLSMYRLGLVEDRLGDWTTAKATLEGVAVRYPRSLAAAEAPMAVIQHYVREGRRTAAELYFDKALDTYRDLVARDSTGRVAPLFRVKMFQLYRAKKDSTGLYSVTEEMLRVDPSHPYTAQVLLEAARAANSYGNPSRGVGYLRRFLQNFPKSPLAGDVRREIKTHGG